jgi:hypothetical protein
MRFGFKIPYEIRKKKIENGTFSQFHLGLARSNFDWFSKNGTLSVSFFFPS